MVTDSPGLSILSILQYIEGQSFLSAILSPPSVRAPLSSTAATRTERESLGSEHCQKAESVKTSVQMSPPYNEILKGSSSEGAFFRASLRSIVSTNGHPLLSSFTEQEIKEIKEIKERRTGTRRFDRLENIYQREDYVVWEDEPAFSAFFGETADRASISGIDVVSAPHPCSEIDIDMGMDHI